ncbi:hypothetical protein DUI87_06445 [Hirundo rustica rustica]|uniref:Uncharacterized protein n=1 Tax=Hirundo rustica rustica TaxID=333673 RepID=A0A3M0L0I2_HIRRU|nr:hypothetical protein DUI87_06445 [Hirundo rustica rustica]
MDVSCHGQVAYKGKSYCQHVSLPQNDPTAAAISDRDCDTREGETVAMNYKPSPLQVKLGNKNILMRFTNVTGNGTFLALALVDEFLPSSYGKQV